MGYTIKDIAKEAGVSVATVSRALNNSSLLKKETMEKIKSAAGKLNYVPNSSAKSLVMNRSFNIGIFFSALDPGITSGYFYKLMFTIKNIIGERYQLIVRSISDYDYLGQVNKRAFDGIIVVSQRESDDKFIKHLKEASVPHVIVNRISPELEVDSFYSNEKDAVKKLIEYFIRIGHNRIAFVKGKDKTFSADHRLQGYLEALNLNDIELKEEFILQGDYSMASGYDATAKIINLQNRPSAIFFSNDDMALGGFKCIKENGYDIPNDFSIAGFDNTKYSEFIYPDLTTIDRPIIPIIEEATKRLLDKIENKAENCVIDKCIEAKLIIRDSVAKKTNPNN